MIFTIGARATNSPVVTSATSWLGVNPNIVAMITTTVNTLKMIVFDR